LALVLHGHVAALRLFVPDAIVNTRVHDVCWDFIDAVPDVFVERNLPILRFDLKWDVRFVFDSFLPLSILVDGIVAFLPIEGRKLHVFLWLDREVTHGRG